MMKSQQKCDKFMLGYLLVIVLFSLHINLSSGQIIRCNINDCQYYAIIASLPSTLFRSAGIRYFTQCSCTRFGIQLPGNTTPSLPTSPVCGQSSLTGSATNYVQSRYRSRIVGGFKVPECQYPWTVFVKAGSYDCGGTLIDKTHVITAAHCLQSGNYLIPANNIKVGVGSSNKLKLVYYTVSRVIRHPDWRYSTFDYDLAILELTLPLPDNNSCIKPVCLPSATLNIAVGTPCLITGWGSTQEGGQVVDDLQDVVVPILDPSICTSAYGVEMMGGAKICAGYVGGQRDACQGDSGGPMLCADGNSWVLAGIVSFGLGCARPNYPGVYAHVPSLKIWIDSVTR